MMTKLGGPWRVSVVAACSSFWVQLQKLIVMRNAKIELIVMNLTSNLFRFCMLRMFQVVIELLGAN